MKKLQEQINKRLMSVDDAGYELDMTYWQTRYLIKKGDLERVTLPGGGVAITTASVERLKRLWGKK